jgi:hypothetical protein
MEVILAVPPYTVDNPTSCLNGEPLFAHVPRSAAERILTQTSRITGRISGRFEVCLLM